MEEVWKLNPDANYIILLEEEVIPSVDFLHYMAQCLPVLNTDETLIGATAWNENGFDGVSSLPDTIYRGNTFPGLGFMLKKTFYLNHMRNKMADCCLKRSWFGWHEGKLNIHEMVIPDVSRVSRRPFMGLTENGDFIKAYFSRPRAVINGTTIMQLANVEDVAADKYEVLVNRLISESVPLSSARAEDCARRHSLGFEIPSTKHKSYSIYFEQDSATDESVLSELCQCFGLFYSSGYHPKGLHQGMMRFSYKENHIFLIGSFTPYYKHKPATHQPVTKSQMSAAAANVKL
jgi:beta-1,2-N-acetylglucosaminyltransferase